MTRSIQHSAAGLRPQRITPALAGNCQGIRPTNIEHEQETVEETHEP